MRKRILLNAAMLIAPMVLFAASNININFDNKQFNDTVYLRYATIDNLISAKKNSDVTFYVDTVVVKNGVGVAPVSTIGNCRYNIFFAPNSSLTFYTSPGENLDINIKSIEPLYFTVYGTDLMNGLSEIMAAQSPILEEFKKLQAGNGGGSTTEQLIEKYNKVITDYIDNNPESPANIMALMELEGEKFIDYFSKIDSKLQSHYLYPLLLNQKERVEKRIKNEQLRTSLSSQHQPAPAFQLPDLKGQIVSLDQFKGKWVILDFWGSWCRWCIKGFPQLKEAYAKYKNKLEIIGIDCKEPEENWRKGVETHKLPWVNVYNTEDKALLERYGVEGFPTKVIVNPKGEIVNITVGENPEFFTILEGFLQ